MREPPGVSLDALRTHLREEYNLDAVVVEFLPRGYDYQAGVYRVVSEQGAVYLLKVTSRPLYEPGYLVPRYLHDHGIAAVVAPLATSGGSLWTRIAEWTLLVYPFLEGDTSLEGMSDATWKETGRIVRQIHQASLPPGGFPFLRRETFDPTSDLAWVRAFPTRHRQLQKRESYSARALHATWTAHQSTIEAAASSFEQLAADLQGRRFPLVIAHADLHPANLLRDAAGQVFLLDWDEVMLAPRERDFIFIRGPQGEAFWEGYGIQGNKDVDWMVLAYFCWERVIQDLIYEARQVLEQDNVSEDGKAIAAERFAASFATGNNVDAAFAVAARALPGDRSE